MNKSRILSFVATIAAFSITLHAQVISSYEVKDLELFSSNNNSHKGLIEKLNFTNTPFGKEQLQEHLLPITDTQELLRRQSKVRFFLDNQKAFDDLTRQFKKLGRNIEGFLPLLNPEKNFLNQEIIKKCYFNWDFMKGLNSSEIALEFKNIMQTLVMFAPTIEHLAIHLGLSYIKQVKSGGASCNHHSHGNKHHKHEHKHKHHHHSHKSAPSPTCAIASSHNHDPLGTNLLSHGHHNHTCNHHNHRHDDHQHHDHKHHHHGHHHEDGHFCTIDLVDSIVPDMPDWVFDAVNYAHWGMHLWSMKEVGSTIITKHSTIKLIAQQLAKLAQNIKTALHIQQRLILSPFKNEQLTKIFSKDASEKIQELITMLLYEDFENYEGVFVGVVLKTYGLLHEVKEELMPALDELGHVEAFLSAATAFQANNYNFVGFIDNDIPVIELENFWHPMLTKDQAIANSMTFAKENNTNNVIITGANRAGKTTVATATTLNLILAQTFGFAAADSMRFTPFHKITTYIEVSDDISTDQSKFVAEMVRADMCLQSIKSCNNNEFSFSIFDDSLFKSTTHENAEKTAYGFIKQLSNFDNNISITITHLLGLTTIEQETNGIFKNYTVGLEKDTLGKTTSTFKLKEGACDANDIFALIETQY